METAVYLAMYIRTMYNVHREKRELLAVLCQQAFKRLASRHRPNVETFPSWFCFVFHLLGLFRDSVFRCHLRPQKFGCKESAVWVGKRLEGIGSWTNPPACATHTASARELTGGCWLSRFAVSTLDRSGAKSGFHTFIPRLIST